MTVAALRSAVAEQRVVVVGAGVVGLACARALGLRGFRDILVLEKEPAFGTATSSRNSGVLHAGIYYPFDSYKRLLCIEGHRLMREFCVSHGVEHALCGKLIVQDVPGKNEELDAIYHQAVQNGAPELEMIEDQRTLQRMEKNLSPDISRAIFSPLTGIVDVHQYMLALLGDAEDAGVQTCYECNIDEAESHPDGRLTLQTSQGSIEDVDLVVNCAGLHACVVAAMVSGDQVEIPDPLYAKGNYWRLSIDRPKETIGTGTPVEVGQNENHISACGKQESPSSSSKHQTKSNSVENGTTSNASSSSLREATGGSAGNTASGAHDSPAAQLHQEENIEEKTSIPSAPYFERLIYPLPEPGGLGTHLTLDLDGGIRFGPNVEWIDDCGDEHYPPTEAAPAVYESIKRYFPAIASPGVSLVPDYSGIRPKLKGTTDFTFIEERNAVHCLGIESPGLTSSLAIADEVCERSVKILTEKL
ncbi:unnamed protein product [Amoebophrya sp. A25]|nr:unnamed protein product [Amoebophrya sp. A25]|eukprot:GSA25T00013254001.1